LFKKFQTNKAKVIEFREKKNLKKNLKINLLLIGIMLGWVTLHTTFNMYLILTTCPT